MKKLGALTLIMALILTFSGCISEKIPEYTIDEDWKVSMPEELGLDPELLSEMFEVIEENKGIDSVLIVRNDYLVVEEYYNELHKNYRHGIYSCTKSITSALIGIAIDNGHIKSVDEKVLDFFPEYEFENADELKKEITIEHLLTMSSGLLRENIYKLRSSSNWVKFVLDNPMIDEPGKTFEYNSGGSHLLLAILQRATGMDTLSYAMEHLFTPLGISEDDVIWSVDPQGIYAGGFGLYMRPRDMAKFGLLYLNKGRWNEEQIVSEEWVKKSTQSHIRTGLKNSKDNYYFYGYQWWIDKHNIEDSFFAVGSQGQYIYIIPKLNMVVVITAQTSKKDEISPINDIIKKYIISAAENN